MQAYNELIKSQDTVKHTLICICIKYYNQVIQPCVGEEV